MEYNLSRFLKAQETSYALALSEIKNAKKVNHYMWYIFPQIVDLGKSPIAKIFSIKSKDEAIAYYKHPILGTRLVEICKVLLSLENKSAFDIFDHPDYMKLKSCLTLFHIAIPNESIFIDLLEKYFDGRKDDMTLTILSTI